MGAPFLSLSNLLFTPTIQLRMLLTDLLYVRQEAKVWQCYSPETNARCSSATYAFLQEMIKSLRSCSGYQTYYRVSMSTSYCLCPGGWRSSTTQYVILNT
jgi:hypothetical protein